MHGRARQCRVVQGRVVQYRAGQGRVVQGSAVHRCPVPVMLARSIHSSTRALDSFNAYIATSERRERRVERGR